MSNFYALFGYRALLRALMLCLLLLLAIEFGNSTYAQSESQPIESQTSAEIAADQTAPLSPTAINGTIVSAENHTNNTAIVLLVTLSLFTFVLWSRESFD